jgi:hypothetical protein
VAWELTSSARGTRSSRMASLATTIALSLVRIPLEAGEMRRRFHETGSGRERCAREP